jgi:hypothetical protein
VLPAKLPDNYRLEETPWGMKLIEDTPVYRAVPDKVEPIVEAPERPVALFKAGTPLKTMRDVAELDNTSRTKTLPESERRNALSLLAETFTGEAKL